MTRLQEDGEDDGSCDVDPSRLRSDPGVETQGDDGGGRRTGGSAAPSKCPTKAVSSGLNSIERKCYLKSL